MQYVWCIWAWCDGGELIVRQFATKKAALEFFSECETAGHDTEMFRLTLERDLSVPPL